MGEITEKVNKTVEDNIRYLQSRVERAELNWSLISKTAERLEEKFTSSEVSFYGSTFSFQPIDSKEAYLTVKRLLSLFPEIERFEKEFDSSHSEPKWKWVAGITKGDVTVQFVVENATPEENCLPIQRIHNYTTWVCQKR